MKEKENIKQMLDAYFLQEKKKEQSQKLQEQIAQQTSKSSFFKWKALAIPLAATILLSLGLSIWAAKQKDKTKQEIAQSQILYEDDDFVIYVQN